ncbi:MAG: alanine--tRNA ligase [Nitrososphaerales archaeon]
MPSVKEVLREKFSQEPNKFYKVELFDKLGFQRKQCPKCHSFFWTLDESRITCPEQPCEEYGFIASPPSELKLGYVETWKKIEEFFVKNGHTSVKRYPVVCRWRPDLFFTIASIVDFQRVEGGKVVFELPANPLVVPQMSLRFSDIGNVGISGRHYTSFCMVGQTAFANEQGYWKDRCIDLDFHLLTDVLKIPKREVVFKEDAWLGPGAFGYSLEYPVRGLELGNAVFTAYEGTPDNYVEYKEKVVDMGAGLNRLAWITNGTPTSYDVVFDLPLKRLKEKLGFDIDQDFQRFLDRYYRAAGSFDVEELGNANRSLEQLVERFAGPHAELYSKKLALLQAMYSILDHTRTLLFAISDGALPSNVGGGYNLRVILRRALDFARQIDLPLELGDVADWHIEQLKEMYPELSEHSDDVRTVLQVENAKYESARSRASKLVESLARKKEPLGLEKLIELYDSEGITPESLQKAGIKSEIPPDFYIRVTERHMVQKHDERLKQSFDVSGIPPTNLLFYLNRDQFEFEATIQRIIDNRFLILDSTAFYARSGGQEPDHGTINGNLVTNVIKFNNVVLHEMKDTGGMKEGELVRGIVDSTRRGLIMRHHSATHVVNGAARKVLGSWVWQHSAFKDEDMGRLDVTHYSHLTNEQVEKIESLSNEIVRKNVPITINWMPRTRAEQMYGFRIYQGGVVPSKEVRIVSVEGWDVEACGGTHCSTTGEIGLIKIVKAERVQDGVERIEFVAGDAALKYVQAQERILGSSAELLETPPDKLLATIEKLKTSEEKSRRMSRSLSLKLAQSSRAASEATKISDGILLYVTPKEDTENLGSDYVLALGEKLLKEEPRIVYVALQREGENARLMVFCGEKAREEGLKAGLIVREIAKTMGGAGGGNDSFAQGGVQSFANLPSAEEIIKMVTKQRKSV